jgi:hypothetical protein
VEDSFDYGNEPSSSIKGGEFLGQMSDYQRLKYDYAPWSYIIERHENRTNK